MKKYYLKGEEGELQILNPHNAVIAGRLISDVTLLNVEARRELGIYEHHEKNIYADHLFQKIVDDGFEIDEKEMAVITRKKLVDRSPAFCLDESRKAIDDTRQACIRNGLPVSFTYLDSLGREYDEGTGKIYVRPSTVTELLDIDRMIEKGIIKGMKYQIGRNAYIDISGPDVVDDFILKYQEVSNKLDSLIEDCLTRLKEAAENEASARDFAVIFNDISQIRNKMK